MKTFDNTLRSDKNILVFNATLAYDYPHICIVIILEVNQTIHIHTMEHKLFMHMMLNDVKIEECHKFLIENPSHTSYTLGVPTTEDNNVEETLIPLSLEGITSYFPQENLFFRI